MILLHKKSILDCLYDFEYDNHDMEINAIIDIMQSLPNYNCLIRIERHERYCDTIEMVSCYFHDIISKVESEDILNGFDFFIGDNNLLSVYIYGSNIITYNIIPFEECEEDDDIESIDISYYFIKKLLSNKEKYLVN